MFSEQDRRQLRGRIWRQPQFRNCLFYNLIALLTGDVILGGIAGGKGGMVHVFASSEEYGRRKSLLVSFSIDLLDLRTWFDRNATAATRFTLRPERHW